MKKLILGVLLALGLLVALPGCGKKDAPGKDAAAQNSTVPSETTAPTVPATVPPDGDPGDVTCKGSYTGQVNASTVVAKAGDAELTNGLLQAYYWAEAAAYRDANPDAAPDFTRPLDTQACEIDSSVASWQQYFLKRALNAWHGSQALILLSRDTKLVTEEAYQPNLDNYAQYLTGMPATQFLYGYSDHYQINTMHQQYLDGLPTMLEALAKEKGYTDAAAMAKEAFGTSLQDLTAFAEQYNQGYMYITFLGYSVDPTGEEVAACFAGQEAAFREAGITRSSGKYVDIRHLLLVPSERTQDAQTARTATGTTEPTAPAEHVTVAPDGTVTCSEALWEACQQKADALLETWQKKTKATDAAFAELANKNSADPGSALNGGAYRRLRKGQLMEDLDTWCFDPTRQAGDTTVIRTDYGCHILYFAGSTDIWYAEAEDALRAKLEAEQIRAARETYPMEINYSAITLSQAEGNVSTADVLYPDVAHERFPEIPLYLQQDYPKTMYGGFPIRTNGCGITSMAMLASYMADDALTPPIMCERYGNYSHVNGTDGMIFNNEPQAMGFYLKEKTYEPTVAKAALEEGHIVISIQHKGYWTGGGHYIVLEKINEDGTIQVRDSNIYNYGKIASHAQDRHTWASITSAGSGYWIFEYKVTRIPACIRCGNPEGVTESLLAQDYYCEKCMPAMLRRETYLSACGE